MRAISKITVPDPHTMVRLLGAGDEILKLVERAVSSDVHVRGNEITITGAAADNALAERIFSELIELVRKGRDAHPGRRPAHRRHARSRAPPSARPTC